MKKTIDLAFVCFFFFTFAVVADETRTWSKADGQRTIKGELGRVSDDGKTVTLLTEDKETIDIAFDDLSRVDQKYIAAKLKTDDNQLQLIERAIRLQVPTDRWANNHYREFIKNVNKFMQLTQDEINALELREGRRDAEASIRLGYYWFGNNRERKAFEHWGRARHQQKAKEIEIAVLIGVAQYARHEFAEARKSIEKAITLGEKDANNFLEEVKAAQRTPPEKVVAAKRPGMGGLGGSRQAAPVAPKPRPAAKPGRPPGFDAVLPQLRKRIDQTNLEDDGSLLVKLSDGEKEGVALYLFLAEKALKEPYTEVEIWLLLDELDDYKTIGRYDGDYEGGFKEYDQIDVYVACLAGYDTAVILPSTGKISPSVYALMKEREAIIETLLPQCNRLSGNAHDEEEKLRLNPKSRK